MMIHGGKANITAIAASVMRNVSLSAEQTHLLSGFLRGADGGDTLRSDAGSNYLRTAPDQPAKG